MSELMSKKDYHFWQGKLDQFDDLSDGAWWQACQDTIGGYNKMMTWLEAGRVYDKKNLGE